MHSGYALFHARRYTTTGLITAAVIHTYRKVPLARLWGRGRDDMANYLEATMFTNSSESYPLQGGDK